MKKVVMLVRFNLEVPESIDENRLVLDFSELDAVQFCANHLGLKPKESIGRGLDPFLHHIAPAQPSGVDGARLLEHATVDVQEYNSPDSDGLPSKTF